MKKSLACLTSNFTRQHRRILLSMLLLAATVVVAPAQTLTTLHSFDSTDGSFPVAGLIFASDGNFYGSTEQSGAHFFGTMFRISPSGTLTTLHSFAGLPNDGQNPQGPLVLDTNGSLYGMTSAGGSVGAGTVFKMSLSGTVTILHNFNNTDGSSPAGGLVQATNGNLYGMTQGGGEFGGGTIFKITPTGTLTPLLSFTGSGTEGSSPFAGLVQATNGDLYGTTSNGGIDGRGTVFQITPSGTLTTLHGFDGTDGNVPSAGLVQATNGILYGTTSTGGVPIRGTAFGTVFRITASGTFTSLLSFDGTNGQDPVAGLIQANDGNLYGTTNTGGAHGLGTIFRITPSGTLTTLHSFAGFPTEGANPQGTLVQGTNGKLYGTTTAGGANNSGTVFSLSAGLAPFAEIKPTSGKEGAKVTILGQGFSGASVVKFGGTKATAVVLTGTTLITATVPAGALTGNVTVTTGTTTLTSTNTFKVLPTVTSFSPASGPVGTVVAIMGTGLEQTSKVTFDGKSATTFKVVKDTEVTADVPTGALSGKITVTTKGGSATSATSFTVN